MREIQPIEQACYYHIYNCGINGENIFKESANYEYFLKLYEKHIYPVADTFAWCLMPNHFHILLRIKENTDIIATINSATTTAATSATSSAATSNPINLTNFYRCT